MSITSFFKNIFSSNCELEKEEINRLKEELDSANEYLISYKSSCESCIEDKLKLTEQLKNKDNIILSKEQEITKLKNTIFKEETEVAKPFWLEGKMVVRPKREIVTKSKSFSISFDKAQWVYDKSAYLTEFLETKGMVGCAKTLTNAQKIHDLITKELVYDSDVSDNWRPISDTMIGKRADCEDSGGIALVSAYGICGWKADEVFNSCGTWGTGGHSYCVVKINGCWYISEGTLYSWKLDKWKNQKKYVCDYGLCNWKFEGRCLVNKKLVNRIPDDNEI